MKIAIVGSQEDKWTEEQKVKAKAEIKLILEHYDYSVLVSGHCPKGGVDIWAEEIADKFGIEKEIFTPEVNQWNDKITWSQALGNIKIGYKSRNIKIADACDILYCIVPFNIKGRCWYHCDKMDYSHIKNGGCWTLSKAEQFGKETHLVVIE